MTATNTTINTINLYYRPTPSTSIHLTRVKMLLWTLITLIERVQRESYNILLDIIHQEQLQQSYRQWLTTERIKTGSILYLYITVVQAWSLWSLSIRYCRSGVRQLTVYNIIQGFPTFYVSKPLTQVIYSKVRAFFTP